MKKIDLFVPQDMPAAQRDVLACLPGEVDREARVFKLNPKLRSVSSIFEMMESLPMGDPEGFATVEITEGSVGPFLATCARNKSSVWQQAYTHVSGYAGRQSAFMSQALANEQRKAVTGVQNFVESVAPAAQGYRTFDVPVLGTMRGDTPMPYAADEDDDDSQTVNPTAEDFFQAARRGQMISLDVGEAREHPIDAVAPAGEHVATTDNETMPMELQAEPTFLANFAATMSVVALNVEQAGEIAKAIVSGLQSPSEEVLQTVRDVFVPRSSMQFFKESIRQDVTEAPADAADAPRMR